jgi:hypothetical protein
MGKVVCQQFLFSPSIYFMCSNNGNHLQEQLAKFGFLSQGGNRKI